MGWSVTRERGRVMCMEGELKAVVIGACLLREEETSGGALVGTVVRCGFGEGFNGGE